MKTKSKFTPQPSAVISAFVLVLGLAFLPLERTHAQAVTNTPVPGAIRFETVVGASTCEVAGTSTLHDWTMKTTVLSGSLEVDEGFPESALANPAAAKPSVRIRVPLRTLMAGQDRMDRKMQEHMEVTKYNNVEYRLIELKPKSPAGTKGAIQFDALGTLTVYGKTVTNTMPVTIEKQEGKLKVAGNYALKMSDHGIPKLTAFGMTVGDDLKIKFDWITAPKAKP